MSYKLLTKAIFDLVKEEILLRRCKVCDDVSQWVISIDYKRNYGEIYIPKSKNRKIEYEFYYNDNLFISGKRKNDLFDLLTERDKNKSDCKIALDALILKYGKTFVHSVMKEHLDNYFL